MHAGCQDKRAGTNWTIDAVMLERRCVEGMIDTGQVMNCDANGRMQDECRE